MAEQETISGFADFVREVADGSADIELGAQLQELFRKLWLEAQEQGKAIGELSVKFKFQVINKGSCSVDYETTRKEPKPLRETSMFFVNERGQTSRAPFKQTKLDFGGEEAGKAGRLRGVS